MSITKETIIGKVEVVGEFKAVHVAMDTLIKEDGKVISQTRHRHVLNSDMDITDILKEPQEIQNICNTVWTQEVKDAWIAFKQEQEAELG